MDSSITGRGYATRSSKNYREAKLGGEALLLAILAFDIPLIEDLLYIPLPRPLPDPTRPTSCCSPEHTNESVPRESTEVDSEEEEEEQTVGDENRDTFTTVGERVRRRERAREVLRILTSPIKLSQNVSAAVRKTQPNAHRDSNNVSGVVPGNSRRLLCACVAVDPRRSIGTLHTRLLASMADGPATVGIGNSLENGVNNDEHVDMCCKNNNDGSDQQENASGKMHADENDDDDGAVYHSVSPALLQPLATFEGDWPIVAALFALYVPCTIPECCRNKIPRSSIEGGKGSSRSSRATPSIGTHVGDWHTVEIGLRCEGCRASSSSSSSDCCEEEEEEDSRSLGEPVSGDPDEDEDEEDHPSACFHSSAIPPEMWCKEHGGEEDVEEKAEDTNQAFGNADTKREGSIVSKRTLGPSCVATCVAGNDNTTDDSNANRIGTARLSIDFDGFHYHRHQLESSFPFAVAAEEAIVSASFAPERTRSPMDACVYWCRAAVLRILLKKAEEAASILRNEAEADDNDNDGDHHNHNDLLLSLHLVFPSPCELSPYRLRGGNRKDEDSPEKEFFIQPAFTPFRRRKVAPNNDDDDGALGSSGRMSRRHRERQARYDVAAYESAQRRVLTAIVRSGVYELVPRAVESGFMFSPLTHEDEEEEREQPRGSKKGRNHNPSTYNSKYACNSSNKSSEKVAAVAAAVDKRRSNSRQQSALDHFERLGYPCKVHKEAGAMSRKRRTAAAVASSTKNNTTHTREKFISGGSDITAVAAPFSSNLFPLPSSQEMYERIDPSERIVRVRDSSSPSRPTLLHLASRWRPEKHFPPKAEDLERVFGWSYPFDIREVRDLGGIHARVHVPTEKARSTTTNDLNEPSFSQLHAWDRRLREKWCSAAIIEVVVREAASLVQIRMPSVASVLDDWTRADGPRASSTAAAADHCCCSCYSPPPPPPLRFALPTRICSRMISSLLHAGIDYELVERHRFYLSQPAIFMPIAVLGEEGEDSSSDIAIDSTARGEAVVAMLSAFFDFARGKDEATAFVGVASSPSRCVSSLTTACADSYYSSPITTNSSSVTRRMRSTLDAHGYSLLLCTLYKLVHDDAVAVASSYGGQLGSEGESLGWCLDVEDDFNIQENHSASAATGTLIFLDNQTKKGGKVGEEETVDTSSAEVDTYTLRKHESLRNREARVVRVLKYLLSPPISSLPSPSNACTCSMHAQAGAALLHVDATAKERDCSRGGNSNRIIPSGVGLSVSLASAPNKGFFPFASLFSMRAAELLLKYGGDPLYLIGERTPLGRVHPKILEMCIDHGLEVCGRGGASRSSAVKHGLACSYRSKCLQRYTPLIGIARGTHKESEGGDRGFFSRTTVEGTQEPPRDCLSTMSSGPPQLNRGSERVPFGGGAPMRRSLLCCRGGRVGAPSSSLRPPLKCFECFRDSTPLHLAVSALQVRLVRLLLANGAGMVGPSSCCDPSPYASDLWVEDYSGKLPIDCVPRASEVSPLAQRVMKLLYEAMGIADDTA